MVRPLGVPLQLLAVEVHLAQVAGGVALRLVVEVLRRRIAALAAGRDRARAHPLAELDGGDEAIAADPIHLLRPRRRARAERGERSPSRRGEPDGNARTGIVEWLHDVAGEPLEAVDVPPRRLPRAEVLR